MNKLRKIKDGIRYESSELKREIKEKTIGYILAGLGLVAGLAWNDAIKAVIEFYFPLNQDSLMARLAYAIAITLLVVILSVYLARVTKFKKK